MQDPEARRRAVAERLADYLLQFGLQAASLRPMAAASGTSDRMLLYYFTDKNELLAVTLGVIAERLVKILDAALPGTHPYSVLLPRITELLTSPSVKPYMQIWLELAALAARNAEPYRTIAGQIADGFLHWTAARLQVDNQQQRAATASLLLATVDGLALLHSLGRETIVTSALQSPLQNNG
jgi:AcrR family transcriptional regulator